jgi:DtxR family transcriptional regulator, Mn-dependent transcriptional regulator
MENHNTSRPSSESEEMYLLTAARLVEAGVPEPIPLSALAQAMAVQPVSANQMVHTLEGAGLMVYTPYKGVQLTDTGRLQAERILRYRRLWRAFLEEHLGLQGGEADALACDFEHVTTEKAARRLEHYLASPSHPFSIKQEPDCTLPLDRALPGQTVIFASSSRDLALYLAAQGLETGTPIRILALGPTGDILVEIPAGTLHLAREIAGNIFVSNLVESS